MLYPSTAKISSMIASVRNHFRHNAKYAPLSIQPSEYLEWINECLDEIYQDFYPQPDEFSINTVVGTWSYALSGGTGLFPNEIGEIFRVDYAGSPLDRYLYTDEIITPATDDSDGTPDGWFQYWDGGERYLGLTCKPSEVVALKIYASRLAENMDSVSGTNEDSLPIERDFQYVMKWMLIAKIYEYLEDFDNAMYWQGKVDRRKGTLRAATNKRFGKNAKQRRVYGATDVFV